VLLYSFMMKGDYGDVKYWQFSTDGWFSVFLQRDIFDDTLTVADAHLLVLWRSVKLSLLTTVLTLLAGFPTAYFIATREAKRRNMLVLLVTIPFWTNLLIRTFAIEEIIRNEGLLNTVLIKLGLVAQPLQIMYSDTAILLGMAYIYLPLMVLPLYASMEKIDFRLVEAGYDLYATRLRVLWRIIIPRILGGGKSLMLGNLIDLQFGQGKNWPLGAALSITLLVIVTLALLVYVRNASRQGASHGH
jgi:spermidine/putrescine transport system permease protein